MANAFIGNEHSEHNTDTEYRHDIVVSHYCVSRGELETGRSKISRTTSFSFLPSYFSKTPLKLLVLWAFIGFVKYLPSGELLVCNPLS